jgi:hypothetical protein
MLPQQFPFERVTLLSRHRRDIKRIIERRQLSLDRLLWAAMNAGDPSVRSPVSRVRVSGSDPGQVRRHDLVGVFL